MLVENILSLLREFTRRLAQLLSLAGTASAVALLLPVRRAELFFRPSEDPSGLNPA